MSTEILSREIKAGWDPETLQNLRVLVVGAGALGQNVLLPLSLSQVGQIGVVDFGTWEISNATRSPMFGTDEERNRLGNVKAPVVINGLERMTDWSPFPKFTYVCTYFEAIGAQHINDFDVIISCVDSNLTRAAIARTGKRIGKPVVEGGFDEFTATYGVYSGVANEACWMCSHPTVSLPIKSTSCVRKGLEDEKQGVIGAVQPVAGMLGNLMANAVIELAHGRQAMLGTRISFADIRRPKSVVAKLDQSLTCRGDHFPLHEIKIEQLRVRSDQVFGNLIEELSEWICDPLIELPQTYVVSSYCISCGEIISVDAPIWKLSEHPRCENCSENGFPRSSFREPIYHQLVGSHLEELLNVTVTNLGIADGDVFFVQNEMGERHAFSLALGRTPFITLDAN